jgi:acyl-coenzyme A synthetase/AMP-(fatty) acid ligase
LQFACKNDKRTNLFFNYAFNNFQPTHLFLYPLFASWLVRSLELAQHDFSFIKVVMIGGGTIDPTTFDLLKKHMPSTFVSLVC